METMSNDTTYSPRKIAAASVATTLEEEGGMGDWCSPGRRWKEEKGGKKNMLAKKKKRNRPSFLFLATSSYLPLPLSSPPPTVL